MQTNFKLHTMAKAMEDANISVLDLAVAIGKHPSMVYQILREERRPSLTTALRIARVLNRSVEELFGEVTSLVS